MSQNIFVTGTNSGFGRLITLTLAKKGHQASTGSRPARVVVDPTPAGGLYDSLNKAHGEAQKVLLASMGMGALAD